MKNVVLLEKKNGTAVITMNRPETLNSLHPDVMDGILEALEQAEKDTDSKVIILTGAGKAFSAGGDLPYLESITSTVEGREYIVKGGQIVSKIINMKKPVVAMVNGVAAGAGFNLALACDIVFCAQSARFVQSFVKVGLIPDFGGTYLLPRKVGLHKAKELMFTADMLDSSQAFDFGIANRVVEDELLEEETMKFSFRLGESAPVALALMKKALNQSDHLTLEDSLELEANMQAICMQTEDNKEGILAFKEKRKPVFKGV